MARFPEAVGTALICIEGLRLENEVVMDEEQYPLSVRIALIRMEGLRSDVDPRLELDAKSKL